MAPEPHDTRPGRTYRVGLFDYTLEKAWFAQFCIGILICVNNGACFCFGIFSPYLKRDGFHYTQSQIDAISTVGVLLSYFSLPTGFLYDHKGPSATLLAGTLLNVTGWSGMFLIFQNPSHPLLSNSVLLMAFFYGLSQLSASFYETGSVLTNLRSFSCYRGRVILIQKTFMGLGSSLVGQVYVAFFEKSSAGIAPFFAFLVVYSTVAGALSVLYLRLPTEATRCVGINVEDADTRTRGDGEPRMFARPFNVGTLILSLSVVFVLATSLVENYTESLSTTQRLGIGFTTIALCAAFSLMIFTTPNYEVNRTQRIGESEEGEDAESPPSGAAALLPSSNVRVMGVAEDDRCAAAEEELSSGKEASVDLEPIVRQDEMKFSRVSPVYGTVKEDVSGGVEVELTEASQEEEGARLNDDSLVENLKHREMWLMWYVCFGAWSAMTVVSSHSSQIYQAIAYDSFSLTVNTVFVSIYGVASALGRIMVGALYPYLARRQIPITVMLPLAPLLNVMGLPLFLVSPVRLLFVPFFVVGLGVGFSWGSTVLIITALFTPSNCGKHYSFLYTAGMLSPLLFNIALFGPLYDYYGRKQGNGDGASCRGVVCIATPLMVCFAVNLFAVPAAYAFYTCTSTHRGLIYTR